MNGCGAIGYFAAHKEEVKHQGYSVMEGVADAYDFPRFFCEKFGALSSFPWQILEYLYTFGYNWAPGVLAIRFEDAQGLWSLIYSAGETIEKPNRDRGIVTYTPTKNVLFD